MRAGTLHATLLALPVVADDPLLHAGRALILAPHADDETLGCGGLIATLCRQRRPPYVLVVTDGTGSHPNSRAWPSARLRALREAEALAATAHLGLDAADLGFLRLRDTAAPRAGAAFAAVCTRIAAVAEEQGCDTLLAPWLLDPHGDHEAVQRMAQRVAASRGLRLLSYPVWGWLIAPDVELAPRLPIRGFRLDVSAHLQRKAEAIRLHASQYGDLITDDPDGFRLPASLLAVFEAPFETFLETNTP
ncbi:PIG-L deacetylase family protein [Lichenicoccus sp.]|uniref:PIG-L deacetylase family protein n=1 Tax=Lichenicoccus sp. TaxID=2781899 RepID=UPI003D13C698